MAEIFISYASSDRTRVKSSAEALGQQGYSVWWDSKIPPGKTFDEVIAEAVGKAKCIVVLWSKEWVKSDWVKVDVGIGKRHDPLNKMQIFSLPLILCSVLRTRSLRDVELWVLYYQFLY